MLENLVNSLKDKKIAILGFGREGQDTFKFLRKLFPAKIFGIADQKNLSNVFYGRTKRAILHFGKNYLEALKNYDLIIKTPGIPFKILRKPVVRKITTQTEIFFQNCPGTIIGVTGTKGKSTTSYFIYQTLKNAGLKAHLIGNIGKPVLTSLLKAQKDDIFVYELSSHQLYNLKYSPHIAVLLNIYPEHLDYYKSFKEYRQAKANITKYQTNRNYLIYNVENRFCRLIANQSKAKKILIQGKYYELNKAAAKAVADIYKIPELTSFKSLPHRLEYVGEFKGIKFYNDSLATIPQTTIEALDYLGDGVQTLILGGYDRGLNFKKLAQRIIKSQVKTLILFPATGKRILSELRDIGYPSRIEGYPISLNINNMKEAVELAYKHTEKGKICLLSPASPSFGIFKDYAERGDLFKKYVRQGRIKR